MPTANAIIIWDFYYFFLFLFFTPKHIFNSFCLFGMFICCNQNNFYCLCAMGWMLILLIIIKACCCKLFVFFSYLELENVHFKVINSIFYYLKVCAMCWTICVYNVYIKVNSFCFMLTESLRKCCYWDGYSWFSF